MISAEFPYQKDRRRRALGRQMAYVEVAVGGPIVLRAGSQRLRLALGRLVSQSDAVMRHESVEEL